VMYASMAAQDLPIILSDGSFSGSAWGVALCPLTANLVMSLSGTDGCANTPAWFVGAMIPSWLCYPLLRRIVRAAGAVGTVGYAGLACACWLFSWIPFVVVENPSPSLLFFYEISPFPFMGAFLVGVATAAIVQLHASDAVVPAGELLGAGMWEGRATDHEPDPEKEPLLPGGGKQSSQLGFCSTLGRAACRLPLLAAHYLCQRAVLRGLLADGALLAVGSTLACATDAQLAALGNGHVVFARGVYIPIFACFLYGSTAGGGAGLCAGFFGHPLFVGLGRFNLQVYLLQHPFKVLTAFGTNPYTAIPRVTETFVVWLLGLWIFAATFTERIEEPVILWFRGGGCTVCCVGGSRRSQQPAKLA